MDSLYLLIPVALIFCAIAIRLLIWAIDSGQYDDLDKDAWRILAEPPPEPRPESAASDSPQKGGQDLHHNADQQPANTEGNRPSNSREEHR